MSQERDRENETALDAMRNTINRMSAELAEARREVSHPFAPTTGAVSSDAAHAAMRYLLRCIGEDPSRAGLLETPRRWVDAMREMRSGHDVNIAKLLKVTFDSGNYDENIIVTDIDFTSLCEHHLLPFIGKAAVAYMPSVAVNEDGSRGGYRVVGLSKIPRVVDAFARRLQMQEQLTDQIANAIEEHVKPRAVGVVLKGSHSCASCRGVRKQGMNMITSVMRGLYREDAAARAEVLHLINGV